MSAHRHAPDPLRNHGYTDLCSCGVRIHRDELGSWVPDDGELDSLVADLDAELAMKDGMIDRIERELVKVEAELAALLGRRCEGCVSADSMVDPHYPTHAYVCTNEDSVCFECWLERDATFACNCHQPRGGGEG